MKSLLVWVFVVLLESSLSVSPVQAEGGGGRAGDGFPKKFPDLAGLAALPDSVEFTRLLNEVSKNFPEFGYVAAGLVARFNDQFQPNIDEYPNHPPDFELGAIRTQLLQTSAKSSEDYISFHLVRDKATSLYPNQVTLLFWSDFFTLPLDAAPSEPSRNKGILHELVHLLITGFDDLHVDTIRLSDLLYAQAKGVALSAGDLKYLKSHMEAFYKLFLKDWSVLRVAEEYGWGTESRIRSLRQYYVTVNGLKKACEEFPYTRETIGAFEMNVPTVPAVLRARASLDPTIANYVTHCLANLRNSDRKRHRVLFPHQPSMGALSDHVDLLNQFVEGASGQKLQVVLSPEGISLPYLPALKAALEPHVGGYSKKPAQGGIPREKMASWITGYPSLELMVSQEAGPNAFRLELEPILHHPYAILQSLFPVVSDRGVKKPDLETVRKSIKLAAGVQEVHRLVIRLEGADEAQCAVKDLGRLGGDYGYRPHRQLVCEFTVAAPPAKKNRQKRPTKIVKTFEVTVIEGVKAWTQDKGITTDYVSLQAPE